MNKNCDWCRESYEATHHSRRYCSDACRQSAWRSRNMTPETYRRADLKKNYGITPEDYDEMLEAQSGVCAICEQNCGSGRRLAVDHNHATGAVRGLLCTKCNTSLGNANDDPQILIAMAMYLISHSKEGIKNGNN